ncbi:hypothetical protein ScPMuIL_006756 [Solemya velum]
MPPPDRWEQYEPMGDVIPGTKIIVFKVPLKQELCRNLQKHMWFTPKILMEKVEVKGYKLNMVIDLTFSTKYYNPEEFKSCSVEYTKIFTEGHHIPNDRVVQHFFEAMSVFDHSTETNSLVGVHCTHGINRTGYIVCRYMIEKLGFTAEDAIREFTKARGYPIERQNYLDDLKTRPLTCKEAAKDRMKKKDGYMHNSSGSNTRGAQSGMGHYHRHHHDENFGRNGTYNHSDWRQPHTAQHPAFLSRQRWSNWHSHYKNPPYASYERDFRQSNTSNSWDRHSYSDNRDDHSSPWGRNRGQYRDQNREFYK